MSWNSYISDSNLLVSQFKAKLTTVFNKAKTINQTIAEDYNVNNYNIINLMILFYKILILQIQLQHLMILLQIEELILYY